MDLKTLQPLQSESLRKQDDVTSVPRDIVLAQVLPPEDFGPSLFVAMEDGFVFKGKREDLRIRDRLRRIEGEINGRRNPALYSFEDDEDREWPVKLDYVLVRTRDGKPPYGQEALWTRVWGLDVVDNIYDLGATQNFVDAMLGR